MLQQNPVYLALSNIASKLNLFTNKNAPIGDKRPISGNWLYGASGDSLIGRNFDLEIPLTGGLVRDSVRLRRLLEMRAYCPEIKKAVAIQRDDVFSSEHGDDTGFWVSDWIDREKTIPVNPTVKKLLNDFIYQHFGAEDCKPIVAEALSVGDSFCEIVFSDDMKQIQRLIRLPVGEMFRIQDNRGYLQGFDRRSYMSEETQAAAARGTRYHPAQIVHWRYQPVNIYGESLFEESQPDWEDLKKGEIDLAKACRDLGVIPVHHEMAPGSTVTDRVDYELNHRRSKEQFLITDLYTIPGVKINRISRTAANVTPLVDRVLMRRKRIAMSCRTPLYLLGIQEDGAKQLSGQPAEAYARHLASVRQMFSQGVNFVLDLHLLLNGISPDLWRYQLEFPKIIVNPFNQPAPANNQEKIL